MHIEFYYDKLRNGLDHGESMAGFEIHCLRLAKNRLSTELQGAREPANFEGPLPLSFTPKQLPPPHTYIIPFAPLSLSLFVFHSFILLTHYLLKRTRITCSLSLLCTHSLSLSLSGSLRCLSTCEEDECKDEETMKGEILP